MTNLTHDSYFIVTLSCTLFLFFFCEAPSKIDTKTNRYPLNGPELAPLDQNPLLCRFVQSKIDTKTNQNPVNGPELAPPNQNPLLCRFMQSKIDTKTNLNSVTGPELAQLDQNLLLCRFVQPKIDTKTNQNPVNGPELAPLDHYCADLCRRKVKVTNLPTKYIIILILKYH